MNTMTQVDRLQTLFRAFRERDDKLFNRAAESIIADELAANHHAVARELRSALQPPDYDRSKPEQFFDEHLTQR